MSSEARRRLVYRLDLIVIIALLITSGLAAVLFALQVEGEDDDDSAADVVVSVPTATHTAVATATLLPTVTPTSSSLPPTTLTLTPTVTVSATPTVIVTASPTVTHTPTATITASATLTHTPRPSATVTPPPTLTATDTPTPWPSPIVNVLPDPLYAAQPVTITGQAQPRDTIHFYDQGQWLGGVVADNAGSWIIDLPDGLAEGEYDLTVVAVSVNGAVSDSTQVQTRVLPAPTPTSTNTPTPTTLPTATATAAPSATNTATASATVPPTPVPSATATPVPTATSTPVPTATAVVIVPTDTPTPLPSPTLPATATPTALPTATDTVTPAPTQTPTTAPVPTATLLPVSAAPQIAPLPPELVVGEPVMLTGTAAPGQTVIVSVGSNVVWEIPVQDNGIWSLRWIPAASGLVTVSAVAADSNGQQSAPAAVEAFVWSIRPRIDAPSPGTVVAPGVVTVSGVAQARTTVTIQHAQTGAVYATVAVPDSERWTATITLNGEGDVPLVAIVAAANGSALSSASLMVTVAPPLQSDTGAVLETTDADETGRTFTALLALLLVAGGFSIIIAGRVLTLWARDRS